MRARIPIVVACAAVAAAIGAARADAHAVVQPSASRPADLQLYTLTVPTERDVPTTGVDLKVPAGIDFVLVESSGPWQPRLTKVNGRVDEIHWSGASVPPDSFARVRFIARNPITPGSLQWRIVQRYADHQDVHWIGPPDSEEPASVTQISEQATPVDVVAGLNGGAPASATPASSDATASASAPVAATSESDGRDTLTLVLAILGVLGGAAALVLALRPGRRGGSPT